MQVQPPPWSMQWQCTKHVCMWLCMHANGHEAMTSMSEVDLDEMRLVQAVSYDSYCMHM